MPWQCFFSVNIWLSLRSAARRVWSSHSCFDFTRSHHDYRRHIASAPLKTQPEPEEEPPSSRFKVAGDDDEFLPSSPPSGLIHSDDDSEDEEHVSEVQRSPHKVNVAGKPPEAGIIVKVYVENFMCHKKMSVELCRNVNFISGQNGSGKSAVLAAVQICLGAGARRTNRAKSLSKLINHNGSATHAKLRVKLLNRGPDAYQHDVYGDYVTVERILDRSGGSSYKLLDEDDKPRSRKKADLDAMLDLFNIQVDNPVAVLDQEESKKFLRGPPEDKYSFFCKATELERIDKHYASTRDSIEDLENDRRSIIKTLRPQKQIVEDLEAEWEECQKLDKLEAKVSDATVNISWAMVTAMEEEHQALEGRLFKMQQEYDTYEVKLDDFLKKGAGAGTEGAASESELEATIEKLSNEATEAASKKSE